MLPEERAKSRFLMVEILAGRIAEDDVPDFATMQMRTAWHESAHAVIGLALGQYLPLKLHSVSVIACTADQTLGRALFGEPCAPSMPRLSANDRRKAVCVAWLLEPDWRAMLREIRWCQGYARQLVRHAYRFEIAAVARALMERLELSATEVQDIVWKAQREYLERWRAIEAAACGAQCDSVASERGPNGLEPVRASDRQRAQTRCRLL